MSHQLWPRDEASFLEPEEVVRRLRAAFPDVEVDPRRGVEEVAAAESHMRRIAGPGQPFSTDDVDRKHRNRERAVHVSVADGAVTGATVVEVDERLLVSHAS